MSSQQSSNTNPVNRSRKSENEKHRYSGDYEYHAPSSRGHTTSLDDLSFYEEIERM